MMPDWEYDRAQQIARQEAYWVRKGFHPTVAMLQVRWERRHAIVRMHERGMTYAEIGKALHITAGRVGSIYLYTKNKRVIPPIIEDLNGWGKWSKLRRGRTTMQILAILADSKRDWLWL
jgi:hypothetical protein